jgi:hypothetical protein
VKRWMNRTCDGFRGGRPATRGEARRAAHGQALARLHQEGALPISGLNAPRGRLSPVPPGANSGSNSARAICSPAMAWSEGFERSTLSSWPLRSDFESWGLFPFSLRRISGSAGQRKTAISRQSIPRTEGCSSSDHACLCRFGRTTTLSSFAFAGLSERLPKILCMRSADSLSDPSKRCPYKSIVNLMDAWPRRSAIFFG